MKKNVSQLAIGALIIPFFAPIIIFNTPSLLWLNEAVQYWQFASIFFSCCMFPRVFMLKLFQKSFGPFILLYFLTIVYSTYSNRGNLIYAMYYFAMTFAIITITYSYYLKGALDKVINVLYKYYIIIVSLNVLSILLSFDNSDTWVLGNKNNLIYSILPYLFVIVARKNSTIKDLLGTTIPVLMGVITILCVKSTTSLFAVLMIFVFYIAYTTFLKSYVKAFNPFWIFLGSAALSIVIIVLATDATYLMYVIRYFDKEDTFGRFDVWAKAIEGLISHPLFGSGLAYQDDILLTLGFSQSHNKYLDSLYVSGIVGMFFYFMSYVKSLHVPILPESRKFIFLACIVCAYSIEFLMEGKRGDMGFILVLSLFPLIVNKYELKK